MNKHTPGPWEHRTGDTSVYANGIFIADCVPAAAWADEVPKKEARGNARLIAAAPELVEALTGLLAEVDAMTKRVGWSGEGFREKSRIALAKAVA